MQQTVWEEGELNVKRGLEWQGIEALTSFIVLIGANWMGGVDVHRLRDVERLDLVSGEFHYLYEEAPPLTVELCSR